VRVSAFNSPAKAESVTVAAWAEGANAGAIFDLAPVVGGVEEQ
jgi:hypothetical protein